MARHHFSVAPQRHARMAGTGSWDYGTQVAAARKRAHQRWWALMRRVSHNNGLRDHLGEDCWLEFERFANVLFRRDFLALFDPCGGVLRCCGPLCGGACPHGRAVDLREPHGKRALDALHLDHAHDVQHVCEVWKSLTPRRPVAWDEGVKGIVIAHLLFGVERLGGRAPNIALRCGAPRRAPARGTAGGACHKQHGAHYSHILAPEAVADRPAPSRKRKRCAL